MRETRCVAQAATSQARERGSSDHGDPGDIDIGRGVSTEVAHANIRGIARSLPGAVEVPSWGQVTPNRVIVTARCRPTGDAGSTIITMRDTNRHGPMPKIHPGERHGHDAHGVVLRLTAPHA